MDFLRHARRVIFVGPSEKEDEEKEPIRATKMNKEEVDDIGRILGLTESKEEKEG